MTYASRILLGAFTLALIAFLVACDGDEMEPPKKQVDWVQVTWVRDTPTSCLGVKGNYMGCAEVSPDGRNCRITMPANAADFVIAHELKHCFAYTHTNGRFP